MNESSRHLRRRFSGAHWSAVLAALLALAAGGCNSTPGKSVGASPTAPISNNDPCAARLHQLCGPLLLYYATYHHLPATLDELRTVGMEKIDEFSCPVSNQNYIYNAHGLLAPGSDGTLVIYDATPAHSGLRWAVSIIEPKGNGTLVTKVIAVKDSYFSKPAP